MDDKKIKTAYPTKIWNSLSRENSSLLANTIAYFFTRHLPLVDSGKINYLFPPPLLQSVFNHGFIYSVLDSVTDLSGKKDAHAEIAKKIINSEFNISFSEVPKIINSQHSLSEMENNALILFTFGKDSLLTFSLLKEIGIKAYPFYFKEPTSKIEIQNKQKLINKFEKETNGKITSFDNRLGILRNDPSKCWGWDLSLTGYMLLLVPYLSALKSKYFLVSNEQSTNELLDENGYKINPSFEQNSNWMLHLNNILRYFSLKTSYCSLLEPIQEIMIMYILHHRYPQYAKYQLSCDNDETSFKYGRWCQKCEECIRNCLFLMAIGIKPETVELNTDILHSSAPDLFVIFSKEIINKKFNQLSSIELERIFAFYLVYLRGQRGGILKLFEKIWIDRVRKNENLLIKKYISVYPEVTLPSEIKNKVLSIYEEEKTQFLKNIRKLTSGTL